MEIIEVVNRTTRPLNYTFDGAPGVIRPGYKSVDGAVVPAGRDGQPATEHLPKDRAEMARRQNVKLGTENRWNFGEQEYLIGAAVRDADGNLSAAENWPYNEISHTEQSNAGERFDRRTMTGVERGAVALPAPGFLPTGRAAAERGTHYQDGLTGVRTNG